MKVAVVPRLKRLETVRAVEKNDRRLKSPSACQSTGRQ
jgi:hypothetical protein